MRESNLFNLKNKILGGNILLNKISDDTYRILEFGEFKPMLANGHLIENSLAEILKKYVSDQIYSFKKVAIWRKATNETRNDYIEINFTNNINLENFNEAEFDGFRIYKLLNESIYVSPSLKEKIVQEYEKISELEFENREPLYVGY